MNPFVTEAICEVCGESAAVTMQTAADAWRADSFVRHRNPHVCAENLRAKRQQEKLKPERVHTPRLS